MLHLNLSGSGSLEGGVGRGSGEARSLSDTKIKNACQCQWDGKNAQNDADFASKQGVFGLNEGNLSDIR